MRQIPSIVNYTYQQKLIERLFAMADGMSPNQTTLFSTLESLATPEHRHRIPAALCAGFVSD